MSLQPQTQYTVPIETANVAHAVFPQGNLCMTMSERLSEFVDDETFSHLFEDKGHLQNHLDDYITVVKGLSDRQTAEAVRSRMPPM